MKSLSLQEVLSLTHGKVVNEASLAFSLKGDSRRVSGISSLSRSQPSDIAFFFSRAFQKELSTAKPGILVVGVSFIQPLEASGLAIWRESIVVVCDDPYFSMALISKEFASFQSSVAHVFRKDEKTTIVPVPYTQVHPSAVIASTAILGEGVKIGAFCVIEEGVSIGARSILYPHCYIGPRSQMGEECVLFSNVHLYEESLLKDRIRIHSGCVIGADGFGYAPKMDGNQIIGHEKIYHLGRVVIESDVEIGSNTTIDRGTLGETHVGSFAKLDDQVHLGHNSTVGEGSILCGGSSLAGHARVGRYAYLGGLCGIKNHVSIGDGAKIGAMSLVSKDVPAGGAVVGNPQRSQKDHFYLHALLSQWLKMEREKKKWKDPML